MSNVPQWDRMYSTRSPIVWLRWWNGRILHPKHRKEQLIRLQCHLILTLVPANPCIIRHRSTRLSTGGNWDSLTRLIAIPMKYIHKNQETCHEKKVQSIFRLGMTSHKARRFMELDTYFKEITSKSEGEKLLLKLLLKDAGVTMKFRQAKCHNIVQYIIVFKFSYPWKHNLFCFNLQKSNIKKR